MLVKITGKRINVKRARFNKHRPSVTKIALPVFPYGTLLESFIQPQLFIEMPKVKLIHHVNALVKSIYIHIYLLVAHTKD